MADMSQPPYAPQPGPGDPNSGYSQPGGQYPGYQNPPPQGGYGYGGGMPAPPSGYGVGGGMPPPPQGWGAQPPQQALPRPTTVTYALYALVANIVLSLISSVLVFANRDAYIEEALRDAGLDPSSASAVSSISDSAFTIGAVIGLIFVALWAMVIWFAWKGHNWARIVIWVLGGLSLISAFAAFSSPVGSVVALTVVSLLLTLAAVVLLALKPSNDWYRYQGDVRKYGWPGRA
ncbi:hypothetical protein BH24ACT9_BH24ACT9_16810 [soil metagenome]